MILIAFNYDLGHAAVMNNLSEIPFAAASNYSNYGHSIDVDANTMVIGAPLLRIGVGQGVFVFERTNPASPWTYQSTLPFDPFNVSEYFGSRVSVSNNRIAVADMGGSSWDPVYCITCGAVDIYVRNGDTWVLETRLMGTKTISSYYSIGELGTDLVLEGNTLAVAGSGGVRVYTRNGSSWSQEQFLADAAHPSCLWGSYPDDPQSGMALLNNRLAVIGSCGSDYGVYVFERNGTTWSQAVRVEPSYGPTDLDTPQSIAFDSTGNRLAIGTPGWDSSTSREVGAVYVMRFGQLSTGGSGWQQEDRILPDNLNFVQGFGSKVAFGGEQLLSTCHEGFTGAICAFQQTANGTWVLGSKFLPPGSDAGNYFSGNFAADPYSIVTTGVVYENNVARGVTLTAALRTVEIPVKVRLVGLEVIQSIQNWRNSIPLVSGKTTLVRAHLESLDNTPVPVQLILRAWRAGSELSDSPLLPSGGSGLIGPNPMTRRALLDDTPYFSLPAAWLDGTVELKIERSDGGALECRDSAQPAGNDCAATVTFTPMPAIQVKFIPLYWTDQSNGNMLYKPTPADFAELAGRLQAAFPVSHVEWSVGFSREFDSFLPISGRLGWITELNLFNLKLALWKMLDGCMAGCNTLYYAVLKGPPSRWGGLATFGVASGMMEEGSLALAGRTVHVHELAHLLGQDHIAGSYCLPQNADVWPWVPRFPYLKQADIYMWPLLGPYDQGQDNVILGLDSSRNPPTVLSPERHFELMSYCQLGEGYTWPSDYTYLRLRDAIQQRFGSSGQDMQAAGVPGTYFVIRGVIDTAAGQVTFQPLTTIDSPAGLSSPEPGQYVLRLLDGNDEVLNAYAFAPEQASDNPAGMTLAPMLLTIPANPAAKTLQVLHEGQVLGALIRSSSPPSVTVLAPNGGETLGSTPFTFSWSASDPDQDPLTFVVQYSADDGATWETLSVDLQTTSLEIQPGQLKGTTGATARLRVQANDGFNTAVDESDAPFSVARQGPVITVLGPVDGSQLNAGEAVMLRASAIDREDGILAASAFVWSSDVQGELGTGDSLAAALNSGVHHLSVTVTDSDGQFTTASLMVTVANVPNDEMSSTFVIQTLPYSRQQNTQSATTAPGDPAACASNPSASVWYQFTPPSTALYALDTAASGYDTVLSVWSGDPGALVLVDCVDDAGGLQARLEVTLNAGTVYHILITGKDLGKGLLRFSLSSTIPLLTTPENFASSENPQPILSWIGVEGALQYEVQWGNNNPPTPITTVNAPSTQYTPPVALWPGTYYWRVRGVKAGGIYTAWSETRAIQVTSPAGSAPPLNAYSGSYLILSWGRVSNATGYEVEWASNTAFSNSDTVYQRVSLTPDVLELVTAPLPNGVYYWRVRSLNGNASPGEWSEPQSFTLNGS